MSVPTSRERPRLAGAAVLVDVLRENLEAFAVAIVMALVIKHFCLEAFRIPTSSMKPTLRGQNDAEVDGVPDGGVPSRRIMERRAKRRSRGDGSNEDARCPVHVDHGGVLRHRRRPGP